jgi:cytochrome c-type biogenesis protein CcmH/NrfF
MSNVTAGAVWTLVIPLALLMVVLVVWAVRFRRAEKEEVSELKHPDDVG